MENKNKKKLDIKKIITVVITISIITTLLILSCYALNNDTWYIFNDEAFVSGSGNANTVNVTGILYRIDNDTTIEFTSIQIVITNVPIRIIEIVCDNEEQSSILITNNNKQNYRIKFDNIESVSQQYNAWLDRYLDEYYPPIDPYTPTADFLEWILNDTTTILGFMISNSVLLLVICIVIVSLSIGIIKRLTNKKF